MAIQLTPRDALAPARVLERFEQVRPADVRSVAQAVFRRDAMVVAVVGDVARREQSAIRRALQRF